MPHKYTDPTWLNQESSLFIVVALSVLGLIGRALASKQKINYRKLIGEIILASIGGFLLWAAGMIQGVSLIGILFIGGLSGLGAVKAAEIGGQVWNTMKRTQGPQ